MRSSPPRMSSSSLFNSRLSTALVRERMSGTTDADAASGDLGHRRRVIVPPSTSTLVWSLPSTSFGRSVGLAASPAYVLLFIATLGSLVERTVTISLAPVYWNMSNPIFKSSRNDHVIEVQLYDDIDIVCPFYSSPETNSTTDETASSQFEYYVIYRVKRPEYDNCLVDVFAGARMVLNCSEPRLRRRFTILFEPYQSIPNAPEYHPGSTYYFITTSSGNLDGLADTYQGACHKRNMRLAVQVCCQPSTVPTITDKKPWKQLSSNAVQSRPKSSLSLWSADGVRQDTVLPADSSPRNLNADSGRDSRTSSTLQTDKSMPNSRPPNFPVRQYKQRTAALTITTDRPVAAEYVMQSDNVIADVSDGTSRSHQEVAMLQAAASIASRCASLLTVVISVLFVTISLVIATS